ncbi:hypothetical protein N7452_000266 [Penicillium brevicompactum]|uniref:SH3 domain-containing protein n=1 Tax=Penicillium brevicompactum TaxID=5074 RepID=A0A9W9R055_PENBR|nr:hypothetical protein N7452_000266 [Penicillium brevicompactum]
MTRPQIIRADTLDLQDHDEPSAKDHTKQPEHPQPLGSGRPAPHQELSIRHAEQDLQLEIKGGRDKSESRNGKDAEGHSDDEDEDEDGNQYEHEDGDLADGESDDMMDDDMMDKLSSSPSIDDEDIDFEFVYALHNFVATVDGQANAAKGDTMVLLDDSNSYWWLVRVVKDGSIGYLPAEHIETPTERLARLNKHRNVDLSATMLGDNNEKSKNPLKKAMRRRNAKTVNFGAPTYIDASDVDYSSDEDSEHGDFFDDETLDGEEEEGQDQAEDIVVEPLRPKGQKDKPTESSDNHDSHERQDSQLSGSERRPSSEEFFEAEEPTVSRSRNGTVRNTDSFFKDDTAEPKKISLTPNLLRDARDENGMSTLAEWKEPRGSLDSLEKGTNPQEKLKEKEEKKRKEKKSGMLSGLFKRKKNKDDVDEPEKSTADSGHRTSPQPKTSMESMSSKSMSPDQQRSSKEQQRTSKESQRTSKESQRPSKESQRAGKPQKHTVNKLIKQPPGIMKVDTDLDPDMAEYNSNEALQRKSGEQSIRQVPQHDEEESGYEDCDIVLQSPISPASTSKDPFATPLESMDPLASPVDRPSSNSQWRGPSEYGETPAGSITLTSPQRFEPYTAGTGSESPVNISPVEAYIPVGVEGITDAPHSTRSLSPESAPSSPENNTQYQKTVTTTPGSIDTLSVDTPTWSDSSLRSYMDEENDIRDLFIIVHDKSNVPPAGPDHPITGRLFKEESKRLKEMNNELDEMLVRWMSQRSRNSSSARSMQSAL